MRRTLCAIVAVAALMGGGAACGSNNKKTAGTWATGSAASAPAQLPEASPTDDSGSTSCAQTPDFPAILQRTEVESAATVGAQPGSFSFRVDSDVACQDGFAVAWVTVKNLTGKTGIFAVAGRFAFVLRQKYIRTGVPTDVKWEVVAYMNAKQPVNSVCPMPPPPAVMTWLQKEKICT